MCRIWADACLKGAGASDRQECYMHTFEQETAEKHHINELEAINCVAAVRAFVNKAHAGGTIQVHCDNQCAVDALTSGRAKNEVLAACARAMWYHAATTQTDLKFTHVPGEGMALPDALSRVSLHKEFEEKAWAFIREIPLRVVYIKGSLFDYSILNDFRPKDEEAGDSGEGPPTSCT